MTSEKDLGDHAFRMVTHQNVSSGSVPIVLEMTGSSPQASLWSSSSECGWLGHPAIQCVWLRGMLRRHGLTGSLPYGGPPRWLSMFRSWMG